MNYAPECGNVMQCNWKQSSVLSLWEKTDRKFVFMSRSGVEGRFWWKDAIIIKINFKRERRHHQTKMDAFSVPIKGNYTKN